MSNCSESAGLPVGTQSAKALACNAGTLDNVANGTDATYPNRIGNQVRSLSGISSEATTVIDTINTTGTAAVDAVVSKGDVAIAAVTSLGDAAISGVVASGNAAIGAVGGVDHGLYTSNPLITAYNQYVKYDNAGTIEKYKLIDTIPLPYQVDSATTPKPVNDSNLQLFTTVTEAYVDSAVSRPNELQNSHFYQPSPIGLVVPVGGADFNAGDQVFLNWFVSTGDSTGLSRDPATGLINATSGSIYQDVPKSGPLGKYTGALVASWGDNAGIPTEDGDTSIADMGTFYRVTLTPNGCFSAKMEQGVVASKHDTSYSSTTDYDERYQANFKNDPLGSAVDNMIASRVNGVADAVADVLGSRRNSGGTDWELVNTTGPITLDNYRAFNAINVLDFGADNNYDYIGDVGVDSTLAIQKAWDARGSGVVFMPPGHYKSGPLLLLLKNAQNEGPQLQFKIEATGVKIWSTATGADSALTIDSCKQLVIEGLMLDVVSGVTPPDYNTAIRGMWNSNLIGCDLKNTSFGIGFNTGSGRFNSIYWNEYSSCRLRSITFYASEEPTRRVINSNLFTNCNIGGTSTDPVPYAFYKYGADGINAIKFVSCDISYYSTEMWYIDEPSESYVQIDGGYLDSPEGIPLSTKGMCISTTGVVQAPNSANTNSFYLETGSYVRAVANGGVNTGGRDPSSCYNFIKNGSLRASGDAGITVSGFSQSDINGQDGLFNRYKNFQGSTANSFVEFKSIPLPFDGYYTLTVIAKIPTGLISSRTNAQSNTLHIGSEWTVTSITQLMAEGDEFEQVFNLVSDLTFSSIDIAYVGLSYGAVGQLGLIEHPDANFFSAVEIEKGFETIAFTPKTSTGLPNNTLFLHSADGKLSFKDGDGTVNTLY